MKTIQLATENVPPSSVLRFLTICWSSYKIQEPNWFTQKKPIHGDKSNESRESTNEPMSSGEEDVKSSNPPTEIKPDITTIAEFGESQEETKD